MELVSARELTGMGLRQYLAAGYDVPKEQLDREAARLENPPCRLLIVPSSAFGGHAQILNLGPALTPFVAFDLSNPMPRRESMAPADVSKAAISGPGGRPQPTGKGPRPWLPIVLSVIGVIALLLLIGTLL